MRFGWAVAGAVLLAAACRDNGPEVSPVVDDGYGGGLPDGFMVFDTQRPAPRFLPGATMTCALASDGAVCPGSGDPLLAERCFQGACVGTYVSPTGNDANPGTRAQPKATIGAALGLATQLAALDTVVKPVQVLVGAGTFAENLDVPDLVDLQGGYEPQTWTRDWMAHVTKLVPSDSRGVRFSVPSMTRDSSRLSGFVVIGAAAGGDVSAITVENGAAPALEHLDVAGGNTPALSAAVTVLGGARPYIFASTLAGGAAAVSFGLRLSGGASVELVESSASGGRGAQQSTGAACIGSCATSRFEDVTLSGGAAPESQGLWLQGGDTTAVFVDGSRLRGGGLGPNGMSTGIGLKLTGPCSGMQATVLNSTIHGVVSSNHRGVGVEVTECSLDLRDSSVSGIGSGAAVIAAGVTCDGASSSCTLLNDRVFGAAEGADIRDAVLGVRLGAAGQVSRNVISAGRCEPLAGGEATGLAIPNGPIRVENNVVLGGACETSAALAIRQPMGTLSGEPEVVNNHFDGLGRVPGFSAGVVLEQPRGVFLNNTILSGLGRDGAAFYEQEQGADPSVLRNNNLLGAVLYWNDGMPLRRASDVNGMSVGPNASANISADPHVDVDFRLGPTSPNRSAGAMSAGSVAAPATDRLGNLRPYPAGTTPDIGPDERD